MKYFLTDIVRIAVLMGVLCAPSVNAQDTDRAVTNKMCPILKDELIDPEISTAYKGKRVFLCCQKCRRKFIENPEQYLAALPQFTTGTQNLGSDHSHDHDHDHAHDHGSTISGFGRLIGFLGRLHPIVVHFPVALILMSGLLELVGAWKRRDGWTQAARINLVFGALSAVVAAGLGWAAGMNAKYPGLEDTLFWHRWMGTSLAVLVLATVVTGWVAKFNNGPRLLWAYRILLALGCILVVATGHYGGTLVFGPDQLKL